MGGLLLLLLVGVSLVWSPFVPAEGPSWILWGATVLLALPALGPWAASARRDVFDPRLVFPGLFALAHLLKPLVALVAPDEFLTFFAGMLPGDTSDYWSTFNGGMAMLAVGLPALALGMAWHRGTAGVAALLPRMPATLHRGRTLALAWLFLLTGIGAYGILWIRTGGPAAMFRTAETANIGLGPLLILVSLAWPAAPVLYGLLAARRESLRPLVPLLLLWLPTLAFFPSRGQFVFLGAGFLILYNAWRRPLGLRHLAAAAVAAFVLSLTIIGVRFAILHGGSGPSLGPAFAAYTAVRTDLQHFDSFVYLVGQHRDGVFQPYGGTALLDALLYPVPRAVWPGKPLYLGSVRMQVDAAGGYRSMTTFSMSFLGEWYGNFGFPGVVLGCFAIGLAVGGLACWYLRALDEGNQSALLLYACFGVWLCFSLDRGGFYLAAVNLVTYFAIPLALGLLACGRRTWTT